MTLTLAQQKYISRIMRNCTEGGQDVVRWVDGTAVLVLVSADKRHGMQQVMDPCMQHWLARELLWPQLPLPPQIAARSRVRAARWLLKWAWICYWRATVPALNAGITPGNEAVRLREQMRRARG